MFTGNYERTLDGKGRVVLPPKHRSKLPLGGYLVPLDGCLGLYPADVFENRLGQLAEQVRSGEVDQAALLGISSSAEEVELDAQGRIGLPPRLRTQVNLNANDVVVVGAATHVQIWSAAQWAEKTEQLTESAVSVINRGLTI